MPKIGDVFRTEKDYTSTGREAKPRWFVYLGRVSVFEEPRNIYLCTTTTQISSVRYKNLSSDSLVYFYRKDGLFESDCLLYLEDIISQFTEQKFKEYNPVYKGNIGNKKLSEIIRKIKTVEISGKIKRDILESFRLEGVSTR